MCCVQEWTLAGYGVCVCVGRGGGEGGGGDICFFFSKKSFLVLSTIIPILSIKFLVSWPDGSEKFEIDLQDGGHIGLLTETILAYLSCQVLSRKAFQSRSRCLKYIFKMAAVVLPTKFHISWSFHSGEEAQNEFSRWWPSCIYHRNDFNFFHQQVDPTFSTVSGQLALTLRRSSSK